MVAEHRVKAVLVMLYFGPSLVKNISKDVKVTDSNSKVDTRVVVAGPRSAVGRAHDS